MCCARTPTTPAELARIEGHLAQYQTLVRNLGLGDNASANDLARHQAQTRAAMEQIDARQAELQGQRRTRHCPGPQRPTACAKPRPNTRPCASAPAPTCRWSFSAFAPSWPTPGPAETDLPFAAELIEVRKLNKRGAVPLSAHWAATACAFWCRGGTHTGCSG